MAPFGACVEIFKPSPATVMKAGLFPPDRRAAFAPFVDDDVVKHNEASHIPADYR